MEYSRSCNEEMRNLFEDEIYKFLLYVLWNKSRFFFMFLAQNAKDKATKMVWELGRLHLCEILIFGKIMDMNVGREKQRLGSRKWKP